MFKTKHSIKSLLIRSIIIVLGVAILAIATPFLIYANLGGDPYTVFNQGFSYTLGISYGQSVLILNIIFLIFVLIFDKTKIHLGTIYYLVLIGPLSDLFLLMFKFMEPMNMGMFLRISLLVLGVFCVGLGLGVYQAGNLGAGPADSFNQITASKLKINLRTQRICYDAVLVIIGFFLNGVVGVGTILGIVAVGPIMAPTFKYGAKLVDKMLSVNNPDKKKNISKDNRS